MVTREKTAKRRSDRQSGPEGQGAADGFSTRENADVEERSSPRAPVIYEIVRRLGDEEMARPITSLWWSGVAGGLSISFSLVAEAILQTHLPDAPWRTLLSSLGYTVGFVIVVLSRQQLFTESTITAVLPLMNEFTTANCWRLIRLWSVVLAANIAGTFLAAAFFTFAPVLSPDLLAGMLEISSHVVAHGWLETVSGAIVAGFLIATMVWLIPSAESAALHVIVLMSYLIAAGGFLHIVAGTVEAFMLVLNGNAGFWTVSTQFFLPVLIGNMIGGTALFAMIAYAQVMNEI